MEKTMDIYMVVFLTLQTCIVKTQVYMAILVTI
jgi:hypothetical protein